MVIGGIALRVCDGDLRCLRLVQPCQGQADCGGAASGDDCNVLSTSDYPRQELTPLADLVNARRANDSDSAAARYSDKLLFVRGRVSEAPQRVDHPVQRYYKLPLQDPDGGDHVLECRLIEEQDTRVTAGELVIVRGWVELVGWVSSDPLWLHVCVLVEGGS